MENENIGINMISYLSITSVAYMTKTVPRKYELDLKLHGYTMFHEFWSFYYVESGRLDIEYRDTIFKLYKDDVLYIEPHAPYSIVSGAADVSYKFDFAAKSSVLDSLAGKKLKLPTMAKKFVSQAFDEALNSLHDGVNDYPNNISFSIATVKDTVKPYWQQYIQLCLEFITLSIAREYNLPDDTTVEKIRGTENLAKSIAIFLENNIYNNVSLTDICNEFLYSKPIISSKFKQFCERGVIEQYNLLKIVEAQKLIKENCFNFTQIADMLCFTSEKNFARVFRRYAGCSPSEFKHRLDM